MNPIWISVIVAICIFALTTYINIKIKFAPDQKTAVKQVKTLIFSIILICFCGYSAFRLIKEFAFVLDTPLSRTSLLTILINSFSLFYVAIMMHLFKLLSLIEKMVDVFIRRFDQSNNRQP